MQPYSQDLRERIIAALEANEQTRPEIAKRFDVSASTVEKLWKRWRSTGHRAALPHTGERRRALQDDAERIRTEVARQRDSTLSEVCERVELAGGANDEFDWLRAAIRKELLVIQASIRDQDFVVHFVLLAPHVR